MLIRALQSALERREVDRAGDLRGERLAHTRGGGFESVAAPTLDRERAEVVAAEPDRNGELCGILRRRLARGCARVAQRNRDALDGKLLVHVAHDVEIGRAHV